MTVEAQGELAELEPRLRARLHPLTGIDHDRHRPVTDPRTPGKDEADYTPAAVLAGLIARPEGLSVLLTRRSDALRRHSGQVALPGGRAEPGETPVQTALREAEEEVGLAREFVDVLGYLDDQVVISGFRVTPVVGLVRPGYSLRLDPTEVARVFEVPLDYVIDPGNHRPRRVLLGGQELHLKDVAYEGDTIWGATGGMLITLAATLADAAPESTHDHR